MKRTGKVFVALWFSIVAGSASAAEPLPVTASQLAGKTLSAVAFVGRSAGTPSADIPGGGELTRIMLQAYLGPGGRAVVHAWDPGRDAYTEPVERRWSLSGSTLCVEVPLVGTQPICANVHMWGPRIAGIGVKPYTMLDGDLQPGNAIGASR
jgi:hypothetical protein